MASIHGDAHQSLKLDLLRKELLSSKLDGQESGESEKKAEASREEIADFGETLFHRAPEDFLQRVSVAAMAEIAAYAHRCFSSYTSEKNKYIVKVNSPDSPSELKDYTTIVTAISDRPFVVDSLLEFLHVHNLHNHVLLHPIIRLEDGRRVSLVYIQTDRLEGEESLALLKSTLEGILENLLLATDDFTTMLVRVETAARLIEKGVQANTVPEGERRELGDFLRWLADGGFVFLGYREWSLDINQSGRTLEPNESADLGFFRTADKKLKAELEELNRDAQYLFEKKEELMLFSRSLVESPIHRRVRMDAVTLKTVSLDGQTAKIQCFLGILTTRSITQEVAAVPIIRRKLQRIIELEGLLPNSHDYKEVVSIIDGMPKPELFQNDIDNIRRALILVLSLQKRNETRVSMHMDCLHRFISIMVVLPREKFTSSVRYRIQSYLEDILQAPAGSSDYRLAVSESPQIRIYFFVPNPSYADVRVDEAELQKSIVELALTWNDNLLLILKEKFGNTDVKRLFSFYKSAFPEQYKAIHSPRQAVRDIELLERVSPKNPLEIAIFHPDQSWLERENIGPQVAPRKYWGDSDDHVLDLKLYKREGGLTLSAILPYLENVGFNIVDETLTALTAREDMWAAIYHLRVTPRSGEELSGSLVEKVVIPGLKDILSQHVENDPLNGLLINPGINCSEIAIARVLKNYLWQIKAFASRQYINDALTQNPNATLILIEYFKTKFDPKIFVDDMESRKEALALLAEKFAAELKNVQRLVHDRVLRALINVIDSTVRTNYFQVQDATRVSLKIDCSAISSMPSPRPMFEIFVNAPDFQGVHLRGGKVARGGLRWSERPEDFRTEVLGLMRTQILKNSIIVPTGAKGGFVLKHRPSDSTRLQDAVRECYCRFITSLLEITDNRVGNEIIHPNDCVIHDQPDPYLVVAADKGTATFSDTANSIASQFDFWLGDAFASGGSYGYDHKKLGITARGAWEAVKRHFREIGVDVNSQTFTVVGIGDMSGEVFGNGLLLSNNTKLIAAFNHKHIFLDPDPDPIASFAERKRLFELPRSNWTDYQKNLISAGGGIYERAQKEIELSPEAQKALGISEPLLSGEELIKAVLRAPVDLLWNGGIGTYVKASFESNINVGDPTNDDVRVDAKELRVKIIGEGGNLGVTQLGRIEYSKVGGHLNVDAVDNSGGVDTSDLEVNLKILLSGPVRRGELTLEDRNQLLASCAEVVREKVLSRNRSQSLVLSLGVHRSRRNIGYYAGAISRLERDGVLKREEEFLPDEETLIKRSQLKAGLTRPELAFLIAYAKITLFDAIIDSPLPEEPFLQQHLIGYFPETIVNRFRDETANHPLRREIIATQVSNVLAERMGASFVYRTAEETGARQTDIISAFLAVDAIVNANDITRRLEVTDTASTTRVHLKSLLRLTSSLDSMTRWILDNRSRDLTWTQIVERYREPIQLLLNETDNILVQLELNRYQEAYKQLLLSNFPEDLARMVAAIAYGAAFLEIVEIAETVKADVLQVARLFAALSAELQITRLLDQTRDIEASDQWESLAARTLTAQLRDSIGQLARSVIEETGGASVDNMKRYLNSRTEIVDRYRQSAYAFQNRTLSIPALIVISNQLHAISRRAA